MLRRFINNMRCPWLPGLALCLASLASLLPHSASGQWVHCPTECNCEARIVRCMRARLTAVPQVPQDTQVL